MRTTLAIDDDVLLAAKEIADHRRQSVGAVISDLVRRSLHDREAPPPTRSGFPLLRRADRAGVVTLDMVNALRDDEP